MVMGKKTKLVNVRDIASLYSTVDMINKIPHGIIFSSTGHEGYVIMEPYSN